MELNTRQDFIEQFEQNNLNGISLSISDAGIENIRKEWLDYRALMSQTPIIRRLSLADQVFTSYSPQELKQLLHSICTTAIIHPAAECILRQPASLPAAFAEVLHSFGFIRFRSGDTVQACFIDFHSSSI